jgi:hypothetical protein
VRLAEPLQLRQVPAKVGVQDGGEEQGPHPAGSSWCLPHAQRVRWRGNTYACSWHALRSALLSKREHAFLHDSPVNAYGVQIRLGHACLQCRVRHATVSKRAHRAATSTLERCTQALHVQGAELAMTLLHLRWTRWPEWRRG